jgi:hypothetical protein
MGQSRDHPWLVRVVGMSLQSIEFETLAKGARGRSRVRARHQHQRMNRGRFLSDFTLERDNDR